MITLISVAVLTAAAAASVSSQAMALDAPRFTSQSAPASQAPPTTRRYLTDEQWVEINKMPEMDVSKLIPAAEIGKLLAEGNVVLLDVREPQEVQDLGTIAGSINIPFLQLERRISELPKDKVILPACNTGTGRGPRAAALLQKYGYKVAGFCGLRDYKGERIHPPAGQ